MSDTNGGGTPETPGNGATAAQPGLTATASSASPPDGRLGARTTASEELLGSITEADQ